MPEGEGIMSAGQGWDGGAGAAHMEQGALSDLLRMVWDLQREQAKGRTKGLKVSQKGAFGSFLPGCHEQKILYSRCFSSSDNQTDIYPSF